MHDISTLHLLNDDETRIKANKKRKIRKTLADLVIELSITADCLTNKKYLYITLSAVVVEKKEYNSRLKK